jgi:hypothetical protein
MSPHTGQRDATGGNARCVSTFLALRFLEHLVLGAEVIDCLLRPRLTQRAGIVSRSCHGWRIKSMVGPMVKCKTFTMLPEASTNKGSIGREAEFRHLTSGSRTS